MPDKNLSKIIPVLYIFGLCLEKILHAPLQPNSSVYTIITAYD